MTFQRAVFCVDRLEQSASFAMANSEGHGWPLLKCGLFGADVIRFACGKGVAEHTHPGNHMLFVVRGRGTLHYDGRSYDLAEGDCYLVPGAVRHAVYAAPDRELVLISVADNHRPVSSEERLKMTNG